MTAKSMPISAAANAALPSKLNTGKPFKGYYYYTDVRSNSNNSSQVKKKYNEKTKNIMKKQ